ncbi:Alpha beta hydrolase fold-3 domain protein [Pyrenophora tritici-repentis]|uniref:Alpha/beta-hydrolase n=3 Tax=Pyrenophora tritici-repentis TaxID=45151 RepID=A0A2W1D7L5_9PLEO|nr:uncharacterized protein PTRG_11524 [Pyrenophora tritici-repentis Pt-1C-BFP]KAG9377598.1 hypothetical protein A1F94_012001 [Pyrenophora tritici-repentis]EDU44574.1 conserved hypothetical protein [Pyrenophora tritici-repentis Pt-1C-BFP]KAI1519853.1 Alpha/beta-hydrolase [Pyrenophora tritici-repentis]KAI1527428.1 Alpha beta hydrolase fold-3 domain protein [Pyrenophora tritici-repentis]KAI1528311.1 Alpha beta hydrolase fold-3 domain protein [Pyrenophora tritici-repentis]
MAPLDDTTPKTRFHSFHVYRIPYKKIGEHEIEAGILVPKDLKAGKHPAMVKFHGGGLITGDCLYPDWISAFSIPLIHRTSSIVILPNYRLLPEHTGAEILSDLSDFWTWFHSGSVENFLNNQPATPAGGFALDYDKVLVSGDSAGGYMALMSGLLQPKGSIKAILAQYPMTNYLRYERGPEFFGMPSPPESVFTEHVKKMVPDAVVSSVVPPERMGLGYAMAAYGHYLKCFGEDEKMWPIGLVGEKTWVPPTWILHGGADTVVDVGDTKKFVEKCERLEGVEVRLTVRESMEHGFDGDAKEDEEPWLKEGVAWVEGKWLS